MLKFLMQVPTEDMIEISFLILKICGKTLNTSIEQEMNNMYNIFYNITRDTTINERVMKYCI